MQEIRSRHFIGKVNNLSETGPYIWLRYATQYTKDGRTHTIEMSIPVPLGATAETREQLFCEAEVGMRQLVNHVEQRVPQLAHNAQTAPVPVPGTRPAPPQRSANTHTRPASTPAPLTAPQPSTAGGDAGELEQATAGSAAATLPPTRPNVGASMPLTLGPTSGDTSSTLSLPEFIQYIKENLDLTPKQAMELLKVKSLSTGINLREALEHLMSLAPRDGTATVPTDPSAEETPPAPIPISNAVVVHANDSAFQAEAVHEPGTDAGRMREARPAYGFNEEISPDEDDALEEVEDFARLADNVSPQLLEQARTMINALRESQGAAIASPKRLQVLNTVAISQISEEQLQAVAQGIWGISALKKLKVDQVEALISWAKQDYFVEEVDAVLVVLEEEHYARGNR